MHQARSSNPPPSKVVSAAASGRVEAQSKRVVIEFPEGNYKKLLELKENAEAPSIADVVRRSLKLFEFMLQQKREGWSFQLVKAGQVRELEILL